MTDTARLRELALAATPGPWRAALSRNGMEGDDHWRVVDGLHVVAIPQRDDNEPDAQFIAACSPDVILALIDKATATDEAVAAAVVATRKAMVYEAATIGVAMSGEQLGERRAMLARLKALDLATISPAAARLARVVESARAVRAYKGGLLGLSPLLGAMAESVDALDAAPQGPAEGER